MKVIEMPFLVNTPVLACGADMKGAFALAKGKKAYLMDGFGDLSDIDNFIRYERAISTGIKNRKVKPRIIAHDLHPAYFSTHYAESLQLKAYSLQLYKIQHHEAHIASAIIDHSLKGSVIGIAFDGTGYGSDGNIWGGEFFAGNVRKLGRAAHLEYIPMPGADMAVKEPWRMAASYLYKAFGDDFLKLKIDLVRGIDKKKWQVLKRMIDKGVNSPLTSSMGRLFDGAASVILARREAAFEAEFPIALEKIALDLRNERYSFDVDARGDVMILRIEKVFRGIIKDLLRGEEAGILAAKFHNTVAAMMEKGASYLRRKLDIDKVVLSGGVFQNRYLCRKAVDMLEEKGFKVYTHARVQTNDSGIPIGQVAIANNRSS